MIESGDKGKMCPAMAAMPLRRATDVKIKKKTNVIFHRNICPCPKGKKKEGAVIVIVAEGVKSADFFRAYWKMEDKVIKKTRE